MVKILNTILKLNQKYRLYTCIMYLINSMKNQHLKIHQIIKKCLKKTDRIWLSSIIRLLKLIVVPEDDLYIYYLSLII